MRKKILTFGDIEIKKKHHKSPKCRYLKSISI